MLSLATLLSKASHHYPSGKWLYSEQGLLAKSPACLTRGHLCPNQQEKWHSSRTLVWLALSGNLPCQKQSSGGDSIAGKALVLKKSWGANKPLHLQNRDNSNGSNFSPSKSETISPSFLSFSRKSFSSVRPFTQCNIDHLHVPVWHYLLYFRGIFQAQNLLPGTARSVIAAWTMLLQEHVLEIHYQPLLPACSHSPWD